MMQEMFAQKEEHDAMTGLLESWREDPGDVKLAFMKLSDALSTKETVALHFKSRPGISYSFRANVQNPGEKGDRLFVIVDIVDDDPENRWLSICFYGDTIRDPDEAGEVVPGGLLGEDGYCFNLYEYEDAAISYLKERIDEAHKNSLAH